MNLHILFENIHWLPVVVLLIFSFAIGFAWHQPFLFGKTWTEKNFPNGLPKFNAPQIFGLTAVMHFIAIAGLSAIVSGSGAFYGLIVGFLISIIWILPAMTGTYLFANRSIKLLLIDSGMYVVILSFSGFILGIWH